ncbi:hypothetical protein D3C72_1898310 [compost metagenome]
MTDTRRVPATRFRLALMISCADKAPSTCAAHSSKYCWPIAVRLILRVVRLSSLYPSVCSSCVRRRDSVATGMPSSAAVADSLPRLATSTK